MKVLLVSPLPPPVGGIASWTVEYMDQMPKLGCTPVLINSAVIGKRLKNVSKVDYLEEIFRLRKLKSQIKQVLKQNDVSVIHFNASCSSLGLVRDYLVLKSFFKHYPVVYHCHCNLETNVNNGFAQRFFCKIAKRTACMLLLNQRSFLFAKRYTNNVRLVPNFINQVYVEQPIVNETLKNIAFVGRVSKAKGVFELLEAAKEMPHLMFHIVGPDQVNLFGNVNLKNVVFYGAKTHDKVIDLLKTMDALVLPSYSEGFPIVVMEAMACGLPVIATSVGSISDMIVDKGGILIPVGDSNAIVQALLKINSQELRSNMASYNLKKVKQEYLSKKVLSDLISLYDQLSMKNI